MNKRTRYKEFLFEEMPVVGIMRNIPLDVIEEILPHYKKAGFTTLEITMNSEHACETIAHLSKNNPTMNIGAGTVCTLEDLKLALAAGASFIVTPIIDEKVITYCKAKNIPVFPGGFTPSEIYTADKFGATAVKLFPATQLGPNYVKDILAPLNNLKLVPTGGVTIDTIEAFFKAGAFGVGMGGSLFDKEKIEKRDFEGLYIHFKEISDRVRRVINHKNDFNEL